MNAPLGGIPGGGEGFVIFPTFETKGERGTCVSDYVDSHGVDGNDVLGRRVRTWGTVRSRLLRVKSKSWGWVDSGTMRTMR